MKSWCEICHPHARRKRSTSRTSSTKEYRKEFMNSTKGRGEGPDRRKERILMELLSSKYQITMERSTEDTSFRSTNTSSA